VIQRRKRHRQQISTSSGRLTVTAIRAII